MKTTLNGFAPRALASMLCLGVWLALAWAPAALAQTCVPGQFCQLSNGCGGVTSCSGSVSSCVCGGAPTVDVPCGETSCGVVRRMSCDAACMPVTGCVAQEVCNGCDEDGNGAVDDYIFCPGPSCTSTCTAETDAAFCARLGKNCGTVTGTDSCGATRTASCGSCGSGYACDNGSNVCVQQPCTPESDATFCSRLGRVCGPHDGVDNCGNPRTVFSCGTCGGNAYCDPDANACIPQTCLPDLSCNGQCGCVTDSCGNPLNCGPCPPPEGCPTGTQVCCDGSCGTRLECQQIFCDPPPTTCAPEG